MGLSRNLSILQGYDLQNPQLGRPQQQRRKAHQQELAVQKHGQRPQSKGLLALVAGFLFQHLLSRAPNCLNNHLNSHLHRLPNKINQSTKTQKLIATSSKGFVQSIGLEMPMICTVRPRVFFNPLKHENHPSSTAWYRNFSPPTRQMCC